MALVKDLSTDKNITASYHKIDLNSIRVLLNDESNLSICFILEHWKDKATRIDGNYSRLSSTSYNLEIQDIRASHNNFVGLYAYLKELPEFENAEDDI